VLQREPNCHFLIVGAGELERPFRQYVKDRNLDNSVTLTGWVPHAAVPSHIAAMDVALMPDSNFYGSPIKIFEYMALGKSVIAPALGPLQEVITDGIDGILLPPGDKQALSDAIVRLARDESTRQAVGRKAKETVLAKHTWKRNAERTAEILGRLLEARSNRRHIGPSTAAA
jgi:glycosyltransferase involved in cell wall biosynthesis